jgi:hypothetical protein
MTRFLPAVALPVALLLLAGCTHRRWVDQRYVPDDLGHSLPALGQHGQPPRLRYDGLYVQRYVTADGKTFFEWYRFWPDGRALHSGWSTTHEPTVVDAETFTGTSAARYCVIDGVLTIEVYQRVDDEWGFVTYDGRVADDGGALTLEQARHHDWRFWLPRSRRYAQPIKYEFKVVGELNRTPEW